jgi:hypothetical protein
MTSANFSTNLDLPFFIKTLLPGFMSSFIITYLALPLLIEFPLICNSVSIILNLSIIDKIIFWIISGLFLGIIITSLDTFIYSLFMGMSSWLRILWGWRSQNYKNRYDEIIDEISTKKHLRNCATPNKRRILTDEIINLSTEFGEYPRDKHQIEATKLGNIITEYETYPREQYGMEFHTFLNRLWYILPEDIRKDLSLREAKADCLLYLSFIFILFSFVSMFRVLQINEFSINFITIFDILASFICFILISFLLYKGSVQEHIYYGRYIKSIFDIFRSDLAKKIGLDLKNYPNESERGEWQKRGDFWEYYVLDDDVS